MTTALFSTLLPDVFVSTADCPQPLALHYLRLAAVDLCVRSDLWTEALVLGSVSSATLPATITPSSAKTVMARVITVYFGTQRMAPWSVADSNNVDKDWREDIGPPGAFIVESGNQLRLVPEPLDAGVLKATISLAPTWDADEMDADILTRYREGIVAGAVARLCSIPGKAFTDPATAALNAAAFNNAVARAKVVAGQGYSRANSRVLFNRFA